MNEHLLVRLAFHPDSSNQERDDCHAYLYEKLDELMREASAFSSYRVITDEDTPVGPGPAQAGEQQ